MCVCVCLKFFTQSVCIHLHIKWVLQCVVSPDKSPRWTALLHSFSVSHACMRAHTLTLTRSQMCLNTHSMAIAESLIIPALLFLIHLLSLPPPTHMYGLTQTHTQPHTLVNTQHLQKSSGNSELSSHERSSGGNRDWTNVRKKKKQKSLYSAFLFSSFSYFLSPVVCFLFSPPFSLTIPSYFYVFFPFKSCLLYSWTSYFQVVGFFIIGF